jgi:predicted transcriptional regulator of viral defense system
MIKLLKKHSTFTAKQARACGVHPSLLAYYVKLGTLERVSRGVYRNPAVDSKIPTPWEDLVATVQSISEGVVCLISALNIYEMTDEFPRQHWIAVPTGHWPTRRKYTRIVRMSDTMLGKKRMKMGLTSIWIFDKERTVIDSFRLLPREVAIKALKHYLKETDDHKPNFKKLSRYSEKLRYDISPYVEALTT